MSEKSRHISKMDFYLVLQKEYFVHYLRARIFPSPSDKRYHKKVMEKKKARISSMAAEFGLPTIFDQEDLYNEVRESIIPKRGLPAFEGVTEKDKRHYFDKGVDVAFDMEEERVMGTVERVDKKNGVAFVKLRGKNTTLPVFYSALTRIL